MWVEAADQDARLGDAEFAVQVGMQDACDPLQALAGDGIGYLAQGQVSSDQRDAQAAGGQHHHHLLGMRQFSEELGMPGEGNAGFVDHALVYRGGDHPGKQTVQAALASALQSIQYIRRIGWIQLSGHGGLGQRGVPDIQLAGSSRLLRQCLRVDLMQFDGQAQLCSAIGQQGAAGDGHQDMGLCLTAEQQTQVGTDTGRLAGGQGERAGHSFKPQAANHKR